MKCAILIMATQSPNSFDITPMGNSLLRNINCKPLLKHTIENASMSGLDVFVVARQADAELHSLIGDCSKIMHFGNCIGDFIEAGVRGTEEYDGWLIIFGDMPFVSCHHFKVVSEALHIHGLVRTESSGVYGYPIGFQKKFRPLLTDKKDARNFRLIFNADFLRFETIQDENYLDNVETTFQLNHFENY